MWGRVLAVGALVALVAGSASTAWAAPGDVVGPCTVDFGTAKVAYPVTKDIPMTVDGATPVTFGRAALVRDPLSQVDDLRPLAFTITSDGCSGQTVVAGATCVIRVSGAATSVPERWEPDRALLSLPQAGVGSATDVHLLITGEGVGEGTFLTRPRRLLDTRVAGTKAPLPAGGHVDVPVTGANLAPAGHTSAVVLNLTAVAPTASGYLAAYGSSTSRPGTSSVNFRAGWTGANLVTVPVDASGAVRVGNSSGRTHVVVDLVGYYLADGTNPLYQYNPATTTQRIFDRTIPAKAATFVPYAIRPPTDIDGDPLVRAELVNLTVVKAAAAGNLRAFGGYYPEPDVSTLNFATGETSSNLTIVETNSGNPEPLGFYVRNASTKPVRVLVDLLGDFRYDQPTGLRYRPTAATRVVDTRIGTGLSGAFGARQTRAVTTPATLLTEDTRALVMNLTGVHPTASTYVSQWASGARPTTSTLNLMAGDLRSNASVVGLDPAHRFLTYNNAGRLDTVMDVTGTFEQYPPASALPTGGRSAP